MHKWNPDKKIFELPATGLFVPPPLLPPHQIHTKTTRVRFDWNAFYEKLGIPAPMFSHEEEEEPELELQPHMTPWSDAADYMSWLQFAFAELPPDTYKFALVTIIGRFRLSKNSKELREAIDEEPNDYNYLYNKPDWMFHLKKSGTNKNYEYIGVCINANSYLDTKKVIHEAFLIMNSWIYNSEIRLVKSGFKVIRRMDDQERDLYINTRQIRMSEFQIPGLTNPDINELSKGQCVIHAFYHHMKDENKPHVRAKVYILPETPADKVFTVDEITDFIQGLNKKYHPDDIKKQIQLLDRPVLTIAEVPIITKHLDQRYQYLDIRRCFQQFGRPMDEGFTIKEMEVVAKDLNLPSFTVYANNCLFKYKEFNKPVVHRKFKDSHATTRKPLVVVIHNDHCYVSDKKTAVGVGVASLAPGLTNFTDPKFQSQYAVITDIADRAKVSDEVKIIYVTGPVNTINKYFREKLDENFIVKVHDMSSKVLEVTKIEIEGRLFIYCQDFHNCQKIMSKLNLPYRGQSYQWCLKAYASQVYGLKECYTSPAVYRFFGSNYAKNFGLMGLVPGTRKKDLKKCWYADIRCCYQAGLRRFIPSQIPMSAEFEPFNGSVAEHGMYIVNAPGIESLLFRGYGFYYGALVIVGIADGLITLTDIIYQLAVPTTKNNFMAVIAGADEIIGQNDNLSYNKMIGMFAQASCRYDQQQGVCGSYEEAASRYDDTKRNMIQLIDLNEESVVELSEDEVMQYAGQPEKPPIDPKFRIPGLNPAQKKDHKVPDRHILIYKNWRECPNLANFMPWFHCIINLSSLTIYEAVKPIADYNNCRPIDCVSAIYVDCLAFKEHIKPPPGHIYTIKKEAPPGSLVFCEPFKKDLSIVLKSRELEPGDTINDLNCFRNPYNPIRPEQINIADSGSLALIGPAGFGKTYLMGSIGRALLAKEVEITAIANTWTAVENIDEVLGKEIGQTVCSVLGFRYDKKSEDDYTPAKYSRSTKVLIIDEFSLISSRAWAAIYALWRKYKPFIIICGDDKQLAAVGENRPLKKYSSLIAEMCGGRYVILDKDYRTDPAEIELGRLKATIWETGVLPADHPIKIAETLQLINIVATNGLRRRLNKLLSVKYGGENWQCFVGQPIICISNRLKPFHNAQTFKITAITGDTITIYRPKTKKQHTITREELQTHFDIGYALTTDRAQGQTIPEPHTIWQLEHSLAARHGHVYVAVSRAKRIDDLTIGTIGLLEREEKLYGLSVDEEGEPLIIIYGIRAADDPEYIYIGQTNNLHRRMQEHLAGEYMPTAGLNLVFDELDCVEKSKADNIETVFIEEKNPEFNRRLPVKNDD